MNTALTVLEDRRAYRVTWEDDQSLLALLQREVGGYIEEVPLLEEPGGDTFLPFMLIIHEEAKLANDWHLHRNAAGTELFLRSHGVSGQPFIDWIVGPMVIVGGVDEEGNTLTLTEEDILHVQRLTRLVMIERPEKPDGAS